MIPLNVQQRSFAGFNFQKDKKMNPTETLSVALIQTDMVWENAPLNRKNLEIKLRKLNGVELAVLPEMFSTGFTMSPAEIAETMEGETISWLKELGRSLNMAICGSLVIRDRESFFNRFVFVFPDGHTATYDKRHTFTLSGEDKVYAKGTEKIIIDYMGWKICPQVCYDLRFPAWSRNLEDYDVLLYVANWPQERISAWDALLKARAIENMSYCIGVNRIGSDGNGYTFNGHSAAFDGLGNQLLGLEDNEESEKVVTLKKFHLHDIREKLKFLQDRDYFTLQV